MRPRLVPNLLTVLGLTGIYVLASGCTSSESGSVPTSQQAPEEEPASAGITNSTSDSNRSTPGEIKTGVTARQPVTPPLSYITELPSADASIPDWVGKRKDEPFEVHEFLQSRMPPEDNAAPLYFPALAQFSTEMSFVLPQALRESKQDEISQIHRQIDSLSATPPAKLAGQDRDAVAQIIEQTTTAMGMIDEAQRRKQCVFVTGRGLDAVLPHAQAARTLARLFVLQAYHSCTNNQIDLAEPAITRTLRMSRDIGPRGPMICQLVMFAIDAYVFDVLQQLLLARDDLTPQQLDRLLAALIQHERERFDPCSEGIRMDYVLQGDMLSMLQQGTLSASATQRYLNGIPTELVNYDLEWSELNRLYSLALAHFQRPYHEVINDDPVKAALDELRAKSKKSLAEAKTRGKPLDVPIATMFLMPKVSILRKAAARNEARLHGAQALITIRRYQVVHRRNPPTLDAAVRETEMRTIPTDPYSGQPLRYALIDDRPTVYSVGSDQRDDGGRLDWKYGFQPGDFLFRIGH
jgi:hypothetical protein